MAGQAQERLPATEDRAEEIAATAVEDRGSSPGPPASTPARNHLDLVAADSSPWSVLLTARLAELCQSQGIRLETPENPTKMADSLRVELAGSALADRPRWQFVARFQSGQRNTPTLRWTGVGEGWDAVGDLTRQLSQRLNQARGTEPATDQPQPPTLPTPRPAAAILEELDGPAGADPARQFLLLGELTESCLRDPQGLRLLFAPAAPPNPADSTAPAPAPDAAPGVEAPAASETERPTAAAVEPEALPDCPWLRLRLASATRARPEAAQLLEDLLLPRGVNAQLTDPAPSQALLCWAVTLAGRAERQPDPARWLQRELREALNRRLDPTAQPHWAGLRGQLRTGLLLADRLSPPRSPFGVELRRALAPSTDGDDLLLTFALALHHLDPVPDDLRQQSADALWQARSLWQNQPGFRPYLQALAVDIASGLPVATPRDLPQPLPETGLPPRLLLPALLSLEEKSIGR